MINSKSNGNIQWATQLNEEVWPKPICQQKYLIWPLEQQCSSHRSSVQGIAVQSERGDISLVISVTTDDKEAPT